MTAKKTMMRSMAIDSPLRRWRRANHYTQAEFAALVGTHVDSVNRWEQAKRAPHAQTLARVMAITGLPSDAILFPERYLREHPEYLTEWAEVPPRRGRRRSEGRRDA